MRFEELDWQATPRGEISLRRRHDPAVDEIVYEVKLGDEFLMSSLFTEAERQLAHLGLAALPPGQVSVLVGGLGLGYTALAALGDPRVAELVVIEAVEPVLDWHRRGLLPHTAALVTDPRCELVLDDFFRLARNAPERQYDAILLDVDHTPGHLLHPSHADLYTVPGLTSLARHLTDGGIFALWSDDPPEPAFEATLAAVFDDTESHLVGFDNPLTGGTSSNTVYLGRRR
ncbi:spermidine synthase [Nocardioides limicola]|uniref:spermidine synthase n=1 Tax=Nocardioides limicola TaxID=2803368 RepID=UPI00193B5808|nr:spermidine synthase [Nocardioides sp. DJM-14]